MRTIIVWFRNDLRVHDHPALHAAAEAADQVIPVFVLSNGMLNGRHSSSNRNRFLLECLADLKGSLRELGADLVLRSGAPEQVLPELAQQTGASEVYYTIDYTSHARARDKRASEALETASISLKAFPGRLAVDSFQGVQAKNGNTYTVFTPFWKNWSTIDRRLVLPVASRLKLPVDVEPGKLPKLANLVVQSQLSADVLKGGESAGRIRLDNFINHGIERYAEMHDSLTPDGTSRLSPYLHFGCISVRQIEDIIPDGDGPARFHRQLAWRDFYNYILFHFPDNAQLEFQVRFRDMPWSHDQKLLEAWQRGQTGYPIIDAAMRQLNREGWMHNRARLIVGSFLTKDLGLDWRLGEQYFMTMLLDGDEANNNGNWQWIASVGVDPAPVFRRLYNPMTQQKRYDVDGSYVRYYVSELARVADKYLAEPWLMSSDEQTEVSCKIGVDYPAPIVDHSTARQVTLERFRSQNHYMKSRV